MTLRARLTLWYAVVFSVLLLLVGALVYYDLVVEPRAQTKKKSPAAEEGGGDLLEILLFYGLPAGVVGVLGGWWLLRRGLAPVTALTRAVERIHAGNLHEQLPRTHGGDELDRLTEVFNAMLVRLDDGFQRTREFTLHASHELKTPLTILRGEMETALRDPSLPAAARERGASQLDELRRLTHIVDSLTLLAKADADLVQLVREPVRLDELVRDNFADAEMLAAASGVEVTLAACEPALVLGDRHRLRQLLLNLADNAVKYNQPQGRVTMALLHDAKTAEFVITNTGPGIPPEILPRVFDRFFRGDPAHDNTVAGCGLGLSIAQWIVSAHGGKIQVASEPGKLTTVTVSIPLTSPG